MSARFFSSTPTAVGWRRFSAHFQQQQHRPVRATWSLDGLSAPRLMSSAAPLRFDFGLANIPAANAIQGTGEDASMATAVSPSGSVLALAVADGVSEWLFEGVDPSRFSKGLCDSVQQFATSEGPAFSPREAIRHAHEAVCQQEHLLGSSTLLVARVDGNSHQLQVANVGDCQLAVVRPNNRQIPDLEGQVGKVVFKSDAQEARFGCPLQLSARHHPGNSVDDAALHDGVEIRPGDVIVCASDGLFDNLWDAEIVAHASHGGGQDSASDIAARLTKIATDTSRDRRAMTPWAEQYLDELNQIWHKGGKMDDITVIVVKVSQAQGQD